MIETTTSRAFILNDRCDSCSAAAMVIVTFLNGELMFCGHHANEMSASLLTKSISVYDPDGFILI
jgi:hypothetical protein